MASNSSSLAEQIKTVLRQSTAPMSALEIGKKLGRPKKEMNKLLYNITDIESVPGIQPPLWKLKESSQLSNPSQSLPPSLPSNSSSNSTGASPVVRSVSEGMSSSTSISDSELSIKLAQLLTSEGQSAPELHRKLEDPTIPMPQVKRLLHDTNIATNITTNKKGKPLWVKAGTSPVVPLTKNGKPLYEKIEKPGEVTFKVATDETNEEEEVKSKPLPPSKIDDQVINDMSSLSLRKEEEEMTDEHLKQSILAHLHGNPNESYTCQDIAQQLGQPTRDRTLYCLTLLVKEGRAETTNDGLYTLKENDT